MKNPPTLSVPDAVGDRIGSRYLVEELLGRGGMAAVYRVVDETNGARLALKRLQSDGDREWGTAAILFEHAPVTEPQADRRGTDVETLATTFAGCRGPNERAQHALRLLIQRSGAAGGYWYAKRADALTLAAMLDDEFPHASVDDRVRRQVAEIWSDAAKDEVTETVASGIEAPAASRSASAWTTDHGHRLQAIVLSRTLPDTERTVAVAVLREAPGRRLRIPWPLIRTLSGILDAAGDAG